MEYLNRGLFAQKVSNGVFLSWRLLGTELDDMSFDVYKTVGFDTMKLNTQPLRLGTNFLDKTVSSSKTTYWVTPSGLKNWNDPFVFDPQKENYIDIPLQTPDGYTPNDIAVGDVDGDGQFEIFLHQTKNGKDNSQAGITGTPKIQCYKLNGEFLWEIDLGKNIREGAHYTQMVVYDLDGDGRAELVVKTADGTKDGTGVFIGDTSKDYRNAVGRILDGPEYLSVFDGLTGKMKYTTDYLPARGNVGGWGGDGGNGRTDNYGNRVDRFLACVAYLDGAHPSVVMCRGYYGRTVLVAWDFDGQQLKKRWVFDSETGSSPFSGQGNHGLEVADVDGDGKDEIIYGSMVVDHDGKGMYSMGLRHGDAMHIGIFDPAKPKKMLGFGVHELEDGKTEGPGMAFFDASNGKVLWTAAMRRDVGRGLSADIDPRFPGYESWGNIDSLRSVDGTAIGIAPRSVNFKIWWDGDDMTELLDGTKIQKWDFENSKINVLSDFSQYDCIANNGTKNTPALCADLFGDWREEVIYRTKDNKHLRIFSSAIPTDRRLYSLMHNPKYRLCIVWQNVGYNQPAYVDYYLGDKMSNPPKPNIKIVKLK